jgi:hypothetical protein
MEHDRLKLLVQTPKDVLSSLEIVIASMLSKHATGSNKDNK